MSKYIQSFFLFFCVITANMEKYDYFCRRYYILYLIIL